MERNLIFISHANPEDNEFTKWLAVQLTNFGYKVWSDVTDLLGGEIIWHDIDDAIRNFTIKFLFVLSKHSNSKAGPQKELYLASTMASKEGIKDFIIPLRIDNLPHSEIKISIHNVDVLDFKDSWAKGLRILLEKLDKDNVPNNVNEHNPNIVANWWKNTYNGNQIITSNRDIYYSNWFPITELPDILYIYYLVGSSSGANLDNLNNKFPYYWAKKLIISFASDLDLGIIPTRTITKKTRDILNSNDIIFDNINLINAMLFLLRSGWEKYCRALGMPGFMMANKRECFYFTEKLVGDDYIISNSIKDLPIRRKLWGKYKERFWHFGITTNVMNSPILVYSMKPHVLFSDDGVNIWESHEILHRARRSSCRNWWNPEWRDRLLASLHWLTQSDSEILIAVATNKYIKCGEIPILFESSVSYEENLLEQAGLPEEDNIDELEVYDDE